MLQVSLMSLQGTSLSLHSSVFLMSTCRSVQLMGLRNEKACWFDLPSHNPPGVYFRTSFLSERKLRRTEQYWLPPSALHLVTNPERKPRLNAPAQTICLQFPVFLFLRERWDGCYSILFSLVMTSSAFSFVLLIFMKSFFVFLVHCSSSSEKIYLALGSSLG